MHKMRYVCFFVAFSLNNTSEMALAMILGKVSRFVVTLQSSR